MLALIAEQVAIPTDQLARFLSVEPKQVADRITRLSAAGFVQQRRFLARDFPWVWLTHRGAAVSGTGLRSIRLLSVRLLTHRRAINEVRLLVSERAPQGRWKSERTVEQVLEPNAYIPDAVFEIGGERHAIEVELTRKSPSALRQVVLAHSNRYDAVLYFCAPQTRGMLDELQEREDWPKLTVRDVPGMERILATHTRGFGQPLCDSRAPKHVLWAHRRKWPRRPQPWERRILALICEQGSIPLDQLARFLDCDAERAELLVGHLCEAKFAKRGRLLADEPDWIWLTNGGTRLSEAGFKTYLPAPGALARLRAINDVRLRVEKGATEARWVGWRTLRRELRGTGQIPNAIVEIGAECHAIEVELTRKKKGDAARMIAHRSANYDAVICFCTPRSRRFYERLSAANHWPKLIIQSLPPPGAVRVAAPIEEGAKNGPTPNGEAASSPPPPASTRPPSRWAWRADEVDVGELFQKAPRPSHAVPPGWRNLSWQPATNPQRSEVDDALWTELERLMPPDRRRGLAAKARRLPDRTALSGILYIARNDGINWPDLPHELGYGSGVTCWERLRRWERAGVWADVQQVLQAKLDDGDRIAWSKLAPLKISTRLGSS